MTGKRARTGDGSLDTWANVSSPKKQKTNSVPATVECNPGIIATGKAAAAVDIDPPLKQLEELGKERVQDSKGDAVVYWMRMQDMRVYDNRALSRASKQAAKDKVPLIVIFVASPQDYQLHDRGSRRIDFMLRNLHSLKHALHQLDVPLHFMTFKARKELPGGLASQLEDWCVKQIFANLEYEVDELRRDMVFIKECKSRNIQVTFLHDRCVLEPGTIKTKQDKAYAVYSPFQRNWVSTLNSNLENIAEASFPESNDKSVRKHDKFSKLFSSEIPQELEGWECKDREKMRELWPEGVDAAREVLRRFLYTKARKSQVGDSSPLTPGAEEDKKNSRISEYSTGRNSADADTSSRLSPYLASGVISARECVREVNNYKGTKKVDGSRDSGPGMWLQEVAWRDFYIHVMCAFPRVSMGRPFQEKYATVKWETDSDLLQAWKDGKTGVPIVDAAMRQMNTQGWMHNRPRMIAAMYLTKDLMLDWRLGERYFMQQLIDGDLASNNGGWQWSASTGTDPQPYFRIFNPWTQSEKADPTGEYIRHFVPELKDVKTIKKLHEPSSTVAKTHGYPTPLVDHREARERALRRYRNPGEE